MKLIELNIRKIHEICKKYNVRNLYAFGSILTPAFSEQSDIDLLVNFLEDKISDPFSNFFDFIYEMQDLLGRKIDLVDESAITNTIFRNNLLSSRQLIYG